MHPTRSLVYEKVSQKVLDMLIQENYQKGDRLPSERQLALTLKINYQTVRKGILLLADYGILERYVGKGTFLRVNPHNIDSAIPVAQKEVERNIPQIKPQPKFAVFEIETDSPFSTYLTRQILSDLGKLGYDFSYKFLGPVRRKRLLSEIQAASQKGCIGALVFGLPDQAEAPRSVMIACKKAPIPIVLNRLYKNLEHFYRYDLPYLGWHETATIYVGFNYLQKIGVERFIYVTPPLSGILTRQRHKTQFEHFLNASQTSGETIEYSSLNSIPFKLIKEIKSSSQKIGVMCYDDDTAVSFLIASLHHGLRPPQDFSLIGANDSYIATLATPSITTTTFDYATVSNSMISKLLSECKLSPLILPHPTPPKLIIRQSCGGLEYFKNRPEDLDKFLLSLQKTSAIRNLLQQEQTLSHANLIT